MSHQLLPCPFCEGELSIEYVAGTCVEYVCLGDCGLVCGSEQICDYMSIEERHEEDAYDSADHKYAPIFVKRVKQAIAIRMNTRAPQADISSDDEIGYIYLQPECCADSHIGMLWSEKDHGECKHGGVWRKFVSREPLKPNTTRRKT
jgi:hypothetical protein